MPEANITWTSFSQHQQCMQRKENCAPLPAALSHCLTVVIHRAQEALILSKQWEL